MGTVFHELATSVPVLLLATRVPGTLPLAV